MRGVFCDIEATGLNLMKHCAIDIAFKIVELDSLEVLASYQRLIKPTSKQWDERDPASLAFNGYTLEMLQDGASTEQVHREVIQLFEYYDINKDNAVFICQNPAFDRSFFAKIIDINTQERSNWPYHWLDLASMYFALNLKERMSRGEKLGNINLSKNSIAATFQLPKEDEPHRAANGVNHLLLCYSHLFKKEKVSLNTLSPLPLN